ncbi:MAG: cadherin-like beta sandwich domain-containing protein [Candidatus Latescibacterota bacterium]
MSTQDATLQALTTDAGPVSPGFSPGRRSYALRVPHRVGTLRVTAQGRDARALLRLEAPGTTVEAALLSSTGVPGAPVATYGPPSTADPALVRPAEPGLTAEGVAAGRPLAGGVPCEPIPLDPGRNLLRIGVTAADGTTQERYELKVIRGHPAPDWVQVTPAAPWRPRDSAGELVFAGRMWLFGGYLPELVSDVWSSADGATWTPHAPIPARAGINIPVNWVHEGRMWVASNDGQLFSSADGTEWTLENEDPPWKGRYAAGGVSFAGRMWVLGGKGPRGLHADVWSSADGREWNLELASAPWSPRQVFSMLAVHDGQLWVVGGGISVYHPFRAYTDVWRSPDGRAWTQVVEEAPWPARIWSTAVSYGGRLWVLGGFRAEPTWNNFADVWYSADGAAWHRLETETCWSPRHELSAYVFDDALWVAGGNAWPLQQDVWRLQIPGLCFLTQPVVEEFATARYTYRARADFSASGLPVRYRLVEGPGWLSLDADTGLLSGVPQSVGDVPLTLEARDEAGESARQSWVLHVIPVSGGT